MSILNNLRKYAPILVNIQGEVSFSHISKMYEGEELIAANKKTEENGGIPSNKPYCTLTIDNPRILNAATLPPEVVSVMQDRFKPSKTTNVVRYYATSKSQNLPAVAYSAFAGPELAGKGIADKTHPLPNELDTGLTVTIGARIYNTKLGVGVGIDYVLIDEPIRYYMPNTLANELANQGITYQAPIQTQPQTQAPQYTQPQAQAPQYAQPQAQAQQYVQPQTQAPQYAQPQAQAPQYAQPQAQAQQYVQPQYVQPQAQAQQYAQPQAQAPQYVQPQTQAQQYVQPQTQAPQYVQPQAPQYVQPQTQAQQYVQPQTQAQQYVQPQTQAQQYVQPQAQAQTNGLPEFMNIPDGFDEELPFADSNGVLPTNAPQNTNNAEPISTVMQNTAPQAQAQTSSLPEFMNIPDGFDEELPFDIPFSNSASQTTQAATNPMFNITPAPAYEQVKTGKKTTGKQGLSY